jgi:hypothetical protein
MLVVMSRPWRRLRRSRLAIRELNRVQAEEGPVAELVGELVRLEGMRHFAQSSSPMRVQHWYNQRRKVMEQAVVAMALEDGVRWMTVAKVLNRIGYPVTMTDFDRHGRPTAFVLRVASDALYCRPAIHTPPAPPRGILSTTDT